MQSGYLYQRTQKGSSLTETIVTNKPRTIEEPQLGRGSRNRNFNRSTRPPPLNAQPSASSTARAPPLERANPLAKRRRVADHKQNSNAGTRRKTDDFIPEFKKRFPKLVKEMMTPPDLRNRRHRKRIPELVEVLGMWVYCLLLCDAFYFTAFIWVYLRFSYPVLLCVCIYYSTGKELLRRKYQRPRDLGRTHKSS